MHCHLGTIPRKPDDPDDPLSIMWWDPTRDDLKSLDSSLVDGLGELSSPKFLSLQAMVRNLESRLDDGASESDARRMYLSRFVEDNIF